MNNKVVHIVAFILLIVGGLNWLLTAFGFNVVMMIFGSMPMVEKAVYVLVGLAAIYELLTHKKNCTVCGASSATSAAPSAGGGMMNA